MAILVVVLGLLLGVAGLCPDGSLTRNTLFVGARRVLPSRVRQKLLLQGLLFSSTSYRPCCTVDLTVTSTVHTARKVYCAAVGLTGRSTVCNLYDLNLAWIERWGQSPSHPPKTASTPGSL